MTKAIAKAKASAPGPNIVQQLLKLYQLHFQDQKHLTYDDQREVAIALTRADIQHILSHHYPAQRKQIYALETKAKQKFDLEMESLRQIEGAQASELEKYWPLMIQSIL